MYYPSDTEAPTMICPTNQTVATDFTNSTAIVVWTAPVATDNSKLTPNGIYNAENGARFGIGEIEVVCKAVDHARNQATCSFVVNIVGR